MNEIEIKNISQGGTVYHPRTRAEAINVGDSTLDVVLKELLGGNLTIEEFKKQFLSKINEDEAQKCITFLRGLISNGKGIFKAGIQDNALTPESSWSIGYDSNGNSILTVDKLIVKLEAIFTTYTIEKLSHVNGGKLFTCASMIASRVEDRDTAYRCYMELGNGEGINFFQIGDQAICKVDSGMNHKYYWRLVTAIGNDYIELSKRDADGQGVPEANDEIIQLGNRSNSSRQSAILIKSYPIPEEFLYAEIDSFSLTGKSKITISPNGSKFEGSFKIESTGKDVAEELEKRKTHSLVLDNEMAAVACDSEGNITGELPVCGFAVYEGVKDVTADWIVSVSGEGATTRMISDKAFEVTSLTADNATIAVTASKQGEETLRKCMSVSKVKAGEDAVIFKIFTASGNIILNGNIDDTLYCRVIKGSKDITDTIPQSLFSWRRVSADTLSDTVWNNSHIGIGSVLKIGNSDVVRRAKFECFID